MLNLEIQASGLNMPPQAGVFGSTELYNAFLQQTGCDSFQYTPLRTPQAGRFQELADAGLIGSFHQSWAHGDGPLALPYRAVLSGIVESTNRIEAMQRRLPVSVPTVVHPNEQYLGDRAPTWNIDYRRLRAAHTLGSLLHQPTVEVLYAWGINGSDGSAAAEAMLEKQEELGFDGIALDLHHLTATRAGMRLETDWVNEFTAQLARLGALAAHNEVQASFRPDFGGKPADLREIAEGTLEHTRAGELLRIIREHLPPTQDNLRLTVETPAGVLSGLPGRGTGKRAIQQALSAELRELFTSSGNASVGRG